MESKINESTATYFTVHASEKNLWKDFKRCTQYDVRKYVAVVVL